MNELRELLLTALLNQGALLLGTVLFFAALGVPLPATVLLMAAGAFAQQGMLSTESAGAAAVAGAVAGDGGSYLLGRWGGSKLPLRLRASEGWKRAEAFFARWGFLGVYVTRFLLTPIALPVNLLAGSTRYPGLRFMAAVVSGELTWVLLFGGLGYAFSEQWEALSALAGDAAPFLLGVALVAWAGARLWRQRQARKR